LRVAEIPTTNQNDTGRGIVRLDSKLMKELGLPPEGGPVKLTGSKTTYAVADTSYPRDVGMNLIRMDGLLRGNCGAIVGEKVKISKAMLSPARKLVISPLGSVRVKLSANLLSSVLKHRLMAKGDRIQIRPLPRGLRPDYSTELEAATFFGSQINFFVKDMSPDSGNYISAETHISIETAEPSKEEHRRPVAAYEDIGGMKEVVTRVREIIELPLKRPEVFARLGIEPPKGVLLHGPPGCGKTLLAKAIADETHAKFIRINGPEIVSKFAGEAEEKLRRIFEAAQKHAPAIIFIDEIDAIAQKRDDVMSVEARTVAQLLTLMDGQIDRGQVMVLAATNRPDSLDPALRRPGRFDREIAIGVPNAAGRKEILMIHTRGMPIDVYAWRPSLTTKRVGENLPDVFRNKQKTKQFLMSLLESTQDTRKISETFISKLIELFSQKNPELVRQLPEKSHLADFLEQHKEANFPSLISETICQFEAGERQWLEALEDLAESRKEFFDLLIFFSSEFESVKRKVYTDLLELFLDNIADKTPGFTGADLAGLVKEAALISVRSKLPDIDIEKEVPEEVLANLKVKYEQFVQALREIEPSALREFLVEVPKVKWDDIGGLTDAKLELKETIELPLKHPEKFIKLGIKPPQGILLYGPPGCGKTLLAKAVANEANANFISIKGPEILSKWVGESERAVRKLFRRAKQLAPCIIFFDEIDAIATTRGTDVNRATERVINQLLTELDGIGKREGIMFVAATNKPELVDSAILRPGRVDRFVYLGPPVSETRKKVLEIHTKKMPMKDVNLEKVASATEGFSGADLQAVCMEAAMFAMRKDENEVSQKNFEDAILKVGPSLTDKLIEHYRKVRSGFRTNLPKYEMSYSR
ncbi:MAG: CDC48 family AAA ATPase, partial [Candidatus Altiarchaeota archaeon]|nr:CDC48 family AAA ATPase [Candidatus Altiarchaeota archaeon]